MLLALMRPFLIFILAFQVTAFLKVASDGDTIEASIINANEATVSTLKVETVQFISPDKTNFNQDDWDYLSNLAKLNRKFLSCSEVRAAGLPSGFYTINGIQEECYITETKSFKKVIHSNAGKHYVPNEQTIPFHFWTQNFTSGSPSDDSAFFVSEAFYTDIPVNPILITTANGIVDVKTMLLNDFTVSAGDQLKDFTSRITGTYDSNLPTESKNINFNDMHFVTSYYERAAAHTHHIVYMSFHQSSSAASHNDFLCIDPHYNKYEGACSSYIANEGALPGVCAVRERNEAGSNHPTQCSSSTMNDVLVEMFYEN